MTTAMTRFIEAMGGTVEVVSSEHGITAAMFSLLGYRYQMTAYSESVTMFALDGVDAGQSMKVMSMQEFVEVASRHETILPVDVEQDGELCAR